jgi:hypothetical protein
MLNIKQYKRTGHTNIGLMTSVERKENLWEKLYDLSEIHMTTTVAGNTGR